jgi:catechol 2,3-dioxygenase-like lactoylglutathione lyase family enzyme
VIIERAGSAGFGRAFPHFWIREGVGTFQSARQIEVITPAHVAFRAADRDQVVAFHQPALRAGGTDIGAPGPRPPYHPGYYGAFVADPDGHNIEAVVHGE